MAKLIVFILSIPLFASASIASRVECETYKSDHLGKQVRYCIQRSDTEVAPSQEPVIYFFHGMGGSSESWEEAGYAKALQELAQNEGLPKLTVISFDTDETSFFSDYGNDPTGAQAYETWFMKEFISKIEKEYSVCNKRECRAVAGFSMGGFGSLKTVLKHPEMFYAAAASCPALSPFSIYETDDKWTAYFNRHPIGALQGSFLLYGIRKIFPSEQVYQENDPGVLAQNIQGYQNRLSFYFDMGGKDKYGFQEGYQRFKDILDTRKISYESFLDPNVGHEIYQMRQAELLRFLKKQLAAQTNQ